MQRPRTGVTLPQALQIDGAPRAYVIGLRGFLLVCRQIAYDTAFTVGVSIGLTIFQLAIAASALESPDVGLDVFKWHPVRSWAAVLLTFTGDKLAASFPAPLS